MVSGARARLAALVLLFGAPARAEDAPKLDYAVARDVVGCPSDGEFRAAVTARVGRDPFVAESSRTLRVDVRLEDSELAATGALVEADGTSSGLRRITGKPDGCREVVEGMALALSLAFGALVESSAQAAALAPVPAAAPAATPPAATPPAATPPAATPPPPAPSPGTPRGDRTPAVPARNGGPEPPGEAPSAGERLRLAAGIAAHATAGVGPGAGVGGALLLRGRRGPFSLSAEGRLDGFASTELNAGGQVTTTLAAGLIAGCGHIDIVLLCPVGLAGVLRAASSGVVSPGSDAAPYVALGGRFGLEWPLTPALTVQGRLDGFMTLLPVDIELDSEVVWSSPPGSAALGAGLLGVFP